MSTRPRTELSEGQRLTAVVVGAGVGCVFVLTAVLGLGLTEAGLILLPMLVIALPVIGFVLWTGRHGGPQ